MCQIHWCQQRKEGKIERQSESQLKENRKDRCRSVAADVAVMAALSSVVLVYRHITSALLWCLDCFLACGVKSRSKPSRGEQGGVFHLCTEGRCSAWMFDVRVCSDRVHTVMNPSSSCGYSRWAILEWKQRWITITHTNNHMHIGRQQLWFWHIIMRSDTFAVNLVDFFSFRAYVWTSSGWVHIYCMSHSIYYNKI